ncbi:AMP-binding protein [Halorientalis litorea]|uniref:AMP-binding protein n=1 Tax=Halorientalis litorea TaxID=2931977 RepID=UPI001FF1F466|nr:AMP-binding protein [Halorientalis litorea]
MVSLTRETVADAVDTLAAEHDGTALRFEGRETTFDELAEGSTDFADGIAALGHQSGDPAAIWLPNRPQWFESYVGFARVGAPVVTVNTRYRTHELEYMLEDSETTTLVLQGQLLTRDFLDMLRDVCPAVDEVAPDELAAATDLALERVVVLDPDGDTDVPRGAYTYDEVIQRGRDAGALAADIDVSPDDPATVFYTSGTTSQPKGVIHDHVSTVTHPRAMVEWQRVDSDHTGIAVIPVCGVAGFDFSWANLLAGTTLVLQPTFDPEDAARAIEQQEVTYIAAVGEMYAAMMDTGRDLTSLERGSAWLVDQDDLDEIEATCEFPVDQPYGLSEGHSHMCLSPPDADADERHRAGGYPIHEDIEVTIRDPETGEDVGTDDPGELHLRGYVRMREYLNKPEKTAEEIDADGWLATGDMCEVADDGRMTYHSRIEDMLRLRGFRVTPQEVESAIEDHAAVERAQVVGVDRGDGEEVAVAFVRCADGQSVAESDLAAFMNEHVADYKVPSEFVFVDSFPTTESPNGVKIQRAELVDRAGRLVDPDRGT